MRYGQPVSHRDSQRRWRTWRGRLEVIFGSGGRMVQVWDLASGTPAGALFTGRAGRVRTVSLYVHLMPGLNLEYIRLPQISSANRRRIVTEALTAAARGPAARQQLVSGRLGADGGLALGRAEFRQDQPGDDQPGDPVDAALVRHGHLAEGVLQPVQQRLEHRQVAFQDRALRQCKHIKRGAATHSASVSALGPMSALAAIEQTLPLRKH